MILISRNTGGNYSSDKGWILADLPSQHSVPVVKYTHLFFLLFFFFTPADRILKLYQKRTESAGFQILAFNILIIFSENIRLVISNLGLS